MGGNFGISFGFLIKNASIFTYGFKDFSKTTFIKIGLFYLENPYDEINSR